MADADGAFHTPSGDHYWTESGWWPFWVPERGLSGSVYTLFRPALGLVASGVHLWDRTSTSPWDAPYSRTWWHLPIPDDADPTHYSLANGLALERVEPFASYRLTFADGDLALDLAVEGLDPPHRLGGIWFDGGERGHYDQPTRVTGTIELRGETIPVACLAIRDRTWHERSELVSAPTAAGYTYATVSATEAFHLLTRDEEPTVGSVDDQAMYGGFLRLDGVTADLVAGRRRVLARRDGHVDRLVVDLEDALGRTATYEGTTHLTYPFVGSAGVLAWYGLVEWELADGRRAWGEDQDCWVPSHGWSRLFR